MKQINISVYKVFIVPVQVLLIKAKQIIYKDLPRRQTDIDYGIFWTSSRTTV